MWVRKIPWRRKWQPTPVFLPRKPMGRGARCAIVHGVTESWTRLSRRTHIGKLSPSTDHNYTTAKTNTKTLGLSTLSST